MTCSSCGTENREGRKFCSACGAPLSHACPRCGAANDPGDRFCGECGTLLHEGTPSGEPRPAPVSERKLVSVLFADLVGFTALSEDRDPEEVRELLSRYFETARTLITRYGGTVEKFIGDAVMAVWVRRSHGRTTPSAPYAPASSWSTPSASSARRRAPSGCPHGRGLPPERRP